MSNPHDRDDFELEGDFAGADDADALPFNESHLPDIKPIKANQLGDLYATPMSLEDLQDADYDSYDYDADYQ
jgi:hypothetical protein